MKNKFNRGYEVPEEFADILLVMDMGAKKHGPNNWLEPNGNKADHESMCNSLFHHLSKYYADPYGVDEESGLPHILHFSTRGLMSYTRNKKGIVHKLDKDRLKKRELMFIEEVLLDDPGEK